jgi:hypothetical protein
MAFNRSSPLVVGVVDALVVGAAAALGAVTLRSAVN